MRNKIINAAPLKRGAAVCFTSHLFIRPSPNIHLLCFLDQLISELRMGNRNESLGFLPGGKTLQIYFSILGNKIVDVCPRIGYDRTVCQCRTDAGYEFALFVLERGRAADKALSARGQISAEYEVQLSAGTAYVLCSCALRVHLAIQVDVYGVVNGNKVVQRGNRADVI